MYRKCVQLLLVEDNPGDAFLIRESLKPASSTEFKLIHVETLEEALKRLDEESFDAILLDLSLPDSQGLDTLKAVQKQVPNLPLVVLTGINDKELAIQAVRQGAQDYLVKGQVTTDTEVLVRSISYAIERKQTEESIRTLNAQLEQRVEERTAELQKSEELFRLIFELTPTGMAIVALDGKLLRVNQALCNLLGYASEELLHRTESEFAHPDDLAASSALEKKVRQGEICQYQLEKRYLTKEGEVVNVIAHAALVKDAQEKPLHLILQLVNITDRKRAEEQLINQALHDSLTGLPNRALFLEQVERALRKAKRHEDYLFAVLFLDLDRFKVINDSLGHQLGDRLLVAIARQLEGCLRSTDTVARLGGDEFTILLEELKDIQEATRVVERIQKALMSSFNLDGHEIFTNASIGIALSSTGYNQASELLRDADLAMYNAKERGRGSYQVFDQVMHTRIFLRLHLENQLRRALERQEFQVYYQPIISLRTNRIAGFEALVRWQHPDRGLVLPGEFIPVAEETGLIVPLGRWVLYEACRQLRAWQLQFPNHTSLKMSINLSGKQLREPALIEQIDQILAETSLDGEQLKLELTESILINNGNSVEAAVVSLGQLRARNIHLCLDDFGTGYSSLSYLHRFPINTLKVDRSFVNRMHSDENSAEIVQTIITLAQILKLDVVAEGVETEEQLAQLKRLKCEHGQGYFFYQPLTREAAEELIEQMYSASSRERGRGGEGETGRGFYDG